jgi:hypothetical protein
LIFAIVEMCDPHIRLLFLFAVPPEVQVGNENTSLTASILCPI